MGGGKDDARARAKGGSRMDGGGAGEKEKEVTRDTRGRGGTPMRQGRRQGRRGGERGRPGEAGELHGRLGNEMGWRVLSVPRLLSLSLHPSFSLPRSPLPLPCSLVPPHPPPSFLRLS
eukprot:9498134-Pyramimonas_sp.AAC.1